ncbi:MAG: hypothetical protein KJ626_09580 [Verrucomicrobia bacterium]|nr:hypothetical protein [Verrucomicrobiota bacterium]
MFADYFRTAIANLSRPLSQQAVSQALLDAEAFQIRGRRFPLHFLIRNSFGKILFAVMTPAIEKVQIRERYTRTLIRAIQTACALQTYRREAGEYPTDISLLVPEYLPEIPIDPFDDRPLRYAPHTGTLYSVGDNLIDDGGDDGKDSGWRGASRIKAPDIVFSVIVHTNHP